MQLKILQKHMLWVVSFAGAILSVVIIFQSNSRIKAQSNTVELVYEQNLPVSEVQPLAKLAPVGSPVRLKISRTSTDAGFENVGVTARGFMGAPKDPLRVGWFSLGQRPGEVGSAVIAGHSSWKDGAPAVFDHLYDVKKGDAIQVEDEFGTTMVFVVQEIKRFDANADTSSVFRSMDGKAHLNLITCEGGWDDATQSSVSRLVVFTDRVE